MLKLIAMKHKLKNLIQFAIFLNNTINEILCNLYDIHRLGNKLYFCKNLKAYIRIVLNELLRY